MRSSISLSKKLLRWLIPSNNPTLGFYAMVRSPTKICTRQIALIKCLTGSSSREKLNRTGPFWPKTCEPYRGKRLVANSVIKGRPRFLSAGKRAANPELTSPAKPCARKTSTRSLGSHGEPSRRGNVCMYGIPGRGTRFRRARRR